MTDKDGPSLQDFVKTSGSIQELNPIVARRAIEGYDDVLSSAQRTDDAFYRQFVCPHCKGVNMAKEFTGGPGGQNVTWVEGEITPQALLRCTDCRLLMNPRSGMIIERAEANPIPDELDLDPNFRR